MPTTPPGRLAFTGDAAADTLLAAQPMALLIGFVLDQQVSVQKAFGGPLELQRRIGSLDAAFIAAMDPADLEAAFKARPALHRFPGNMARRVQELCRAVVERYGGDASRVWEEAADGPDLEARLLALPGIGEMKARSLIAVLGKRFGLDIPALDSVMPQHPTLGDVDSAEALARYQAQKRAYKQGLKGGGSTPHS
ncbi:MAG TPA: HhH-GPD-type base excision DNA repair protein [Candidatus Limnocylindrales bacterium]|nr:HhH-GPD-type base excision DNA repair protein [Candidatus Limnocylindrales bacterium]